MSITRHNLINACLQMIFSVLFIKFCKWTLTNLCRIKSSVLFYLWTSWNLTTLGFGLNAPCLSRCALRLGLCPRSGLEYVKVCSLATSCSQLLGSRARELSATWPTIQSPKLFTASLFTFKNLNKMLIFFPTMTPIDIRPRNGPAHGWHASACQISPPYVELFRRR